MRRPGREDPHRSQRKCPPLMREGDVYDAGDVGWCGEGVLCVFVPHAETKGTLIKAEMHCLHKLCLFLYFNTLVKFTANLYLLKLFIYVE